MVPVTFMRSGTPFPIPLGPTILPSLVLLSLLLLLPLALVCLASALIIMIPLPQTQAQAQAQAQTQAWIMGQMKRICMCRVLVSSTSLLLP